MSRLSQSMVELVTDIVFIFFSRLVLDEIFFSSVPSLNIEWGLQQIEHQNFKQQHVRKHPQQQYWMNKQDIYKMVQL